MHASALPPFPNFNEDSFEWIVGVPVALCHTQRPVIFMIQEKIKVGLFQVKVNSVHSVPSDDIQGDQYRIWNSGPSSKKAPQKQDVIHLFSAPCTWSPGQCIMHLVTSSPSQCIMHLVTSSPSQRIMHGLLLASSPYRESRLFKHL